MRICYVDKQALEIEQIEHSLPEMRGNLPICMAMGGVSDIQVFGSGARASKNKTPAFSR
jgi:predicted nucleotidyltransferase